MILNYQNQVITVEVVRSKRTTLCISVKQNGGVVVKAPSLLEESVIREIVEKKSQWIYEKRKEILKIQQKKIERSYKNGGTLPYLGKEYPMELIPARRYAVEFTEGRFLIYVLEKDVVWGPDVVLNGHPMEKVQDTLKKWYKKQTGEYVRGKIRQYISQMDVTVTSVSMKGRKGQWGSCDSQGNITFHWKLIMASPDAVDYVVVHELCHRKHMDHSKSFWGEVKQILPDYMNRKQWLEDNSMNMYL